VAIATIAAITIIAAQTREATVKKVKKDIKAFDKRNATSATNLDASLTNMS
jgi:hypothetical protein